MQNSGELVRSLRKAIYVSGITRQHGTNLYSLLDNPYLLVFRLFAHLPHFSFDCVLFYLVDTEILVNAFDEKSKAGGGEVGDLCEQCV